MTIGGQYVDIHAFLHRLSLLIEFFVSSLSSRLEHNSRRYQHTCSVELLLSFVEDDREEKKRRKEK